MFGKNFVDIILFILNVWAPKSLYDFLKNAQKKDTAQNRAGSNPVPSKETMPPAARDMVALAKAHGWSFKNGDVVQVIDTQPSDEQKQRAKQYFINGQTRGTAIAQHIADDFKAGTLVTFVIIRNKDAVQTREEILFGIEFSELAQNYKNCFEYFPEYRKLNPTVS